VVHGRAHLRLFEHVTEFDNGLSLLLKLGVYDVLHAAVGHVVLSLLDQIIHFPNLPFIFHFD
jgi:hypothetical protein